MYYLGIDGGGTHTRAELRGGSREFLGRKTFGPFNLAGIGEENFRRRVAEILTACPDVTQCAAICIGGAGSSGGAMEAILREELNRAGFAGRLRLCGDHEIALEGALDGPGLVLIAGTGSICYGRNAEGAYFRCGGWGHILDDVGSAYAIGREALTAAVRTEDGRLPENALHSLVLAHLGGKTAGDIIRFAYYEAGGKAEIAALAPLVLTCAEAGDGVSREILAFQAKELTLLAQTAAARLRLSRPGIALLGGMLERDGIYRTLVSQGLEAFGEIVPPRHDALWGAAEMACRLGETET